MEQSLKAKDLLLLALHELGNRDACPAANDLSDLVLSDLVSQQLAGIAALSSLLRLLQLLFQLRELAVFQSCGGVQIVLSLSLLDLLFHLLDVLTELLNDVDAFLLVLPLSLHRLELISQLRELAADLLQMLLGDVIAFLAESSLLDLQLDDLS